MPLWISQSDRWGGLIGLTQIWRSFVQSYPRNESQCKRTLRCTRLHFAWFTKYQHRSGLIESPLRTGLRWLVDDGQPPANDGQTPCNTWSFLWEHCSRTRCVRNRERTWIFVELGGSQTWTRVRKETLHHRSSNIWLPYSQNTAVHHRMEESQIFLVQGHWPSGVHGYALFSGRREFIKVLVEELARKQADTWWGISAANNFEYLKLFCFDIDTGVICVYCWTSMVDLIRFDIKFDV